MHKEWPWSSVFSPPLPNTAKCIILPRKNKSSCHIGPMKDVKTGEGCNIKEHCCCLPNYGSRTRQGSAMHTQWTPRERATALALIRDAKISGNRRAGTGPAPRENANTYLQQKSKVRSNMLPSSLNKMMKRVMDTRLQSAWWFFHFPFVYEKKVIPKCLHHRLNIGAPLFTSITDSRCKTGIEYVYSRYSSKHSQSSWISFKRPPR